MKCCAAIACMAGLALALEVAVPAQAPAVSAKQRQQYAKLSAEVLQQHGPKQAETWAKIAQLDYEFALASFAASDNQSGVQNLDRASQHADRAFAILQAGWVQGKTKGMKNVEMALQEMTFGMKGLAEQVDYTVRPKVESVGNHFDDLRAKLLQWMFSPKH